MIEHRVHHRDGYAEVVAALADWDAGGAPVPGLHVGDLGWALRDPDGVVDLHGWWDGAELVAVAIAEGPVARPRVAPSRLADPDLAVAVAEVVDALPGDQVWCDRQPDSSTLERVLLPRGWTIDDDAWTWLHLDLTTWDGPTGDPATVEARQDPDGRVEAQRHGFANSSFTREKWERMCRGPSYDPALDLLVHAADGSPAASGTAWLGRPGGTAILEPVSTHRDHRRAGHATRLLHGLAAACRDRGATGLTVWTPSSNDGGVGAYVHAGMTVVGTLAGLTHRRDPA